MATVMAVLLCEKRLTAENAEGAEKIDKMDSRLRGNDNSGDSAVKIGQDVFAAGADIVQIDRLKVYVDVPERDVSYIQRGAVVVLRFGLNGEESFPGVIDNIDRVADMVTRTYRTKIIVDNKKMLIAS